MTRQLEMDAFFTGDFAVRGPKPTVAVQPLPIMEPEPMAKAAPRTHSFTTLEQVAEAVKVCQKCPLAETRTNAVPGQGDPKARLMFVGEGPGADEDAQGLAFVGRAGKLLTDIIGAMGLTRDEVFIGNIIKCRPPGNRDPKPDEIHACLPYLKRQLELIQPTVIVALGAHAARTLLETTRPSANCAASSSTIIFPNRSPRPS